MKHLSLLIILAICVTDVLCLECYHCLYDSRGTSYTSRSDDKCEKKPKPPGLGTCDISYVPIGSSKTLDTTQLGISMHYNVSLIGKQSGRINYERCVKEYQTQGKDTVVIRGCLLYPPAYPNGCTTGITPNGISYTHCVCIDDKCNSSSMLTFSFTSIFALLISNVIFSKLQA